MAERSDIPAEVHRSVEWALQAAERVLEHAPRECPFHGRDFAKLGFERGEPRCESCRQPWRVTRAVEQLERARLARGTHQEGGGS